MNQFTETTRSTINTIKAHALISKALSNDPKPTPGYLFPEIARLTQSPGTSSVALTQLLKIITPSGSSSSATVVNGPAAGKGAGSLTYTASPHVLLKALKILRQLAQSGSVEFRTNLARRGKGPLVEMVGYRGQWDEIHGDRFNEDVRNVAEDLIEYMHANPVQEEEEAENEEDYAESFTDKEAAVMKNSTQDLQGFGNPEYDDSDNEDNGSQRASTRAPRSGDSTASGSRRKMTKAEKAAPPLPGFGNPAFEKENDSAEPTLMTRLVDRLQEMTAPPPPLAMRAAFRQQEQRRQKLFVGEYSMREDLPTGQQGSRTKDGAITLMGTNPFKRTTRLQGSVTGGWGEKMEGSSSAFFQDMATSRGFPLARSGTKTIQFRNTTSMVVYEMAQHIQTGLVRSKFSRSPSSSTRAASDATHVGDLMDTGFITPVLSKTLESQSSEGELLYFWGTAKDICDVVMAQLERERPSISLVDHVEEAATLATSQSQGLSVLTGLIRDMIEWIEQEDWERRLRYLFVLDAMLAHPGIEPELLNCSALPVLSKTLTGPMCQEAPQRSVQELSAHLACVIKRGYGRTSRSRTMSGVSSGKGPSVQLPSMSLLDIGA